MFILLYGQDTYRARERLKDIIADYQKRYRNDIDIKTYSINKQSLEEIRLDLEQQQIFNKKKIVIFENAFSLQNLKDYVAQKIRNAKNTGDIFIILQEGNISSKDTFLKLLQQKGLVEQFDFLKGYSLKMWVKKKFRIYNTKVDDKAVEKLIQYVGSDSWGLSNEILKLATFCFDREVRAEDVEFITEPKIELDIFIAIDALVQKDKQRALSLLKKCLKKGSTPFYLLSMIIYQFRNLILAKSGDIHKLKIHPFVLKKSKILSNRFTLQRLRRIYQIIFDTEIKIKTGIIDPELALDLLISEI